MKEGLTRRQKIAGGAFWGGTLGIFVEALAYQNKSVMLATGATAVIGLIGGISAKRETITESSTEISHKPGSKRTEPLPRSGTIIEAEFREINKP